MHAFLNQPSTQLFVAGTSLTHVLSPFLVFLSKDEEFFCYGALVERDIRVVVAMESPLKKGHLIRF